MKSPFLPVAFFAAPLLFSSLAHAQKPRVVSSPPRATSSELYNFNRAPLQPLAFAKLPPGAVVPRGWLREQLQLDAQGLSGHLPEISNFLKFEGNGWVDAKSDSGWEELGYWLRGYGDLGYVLGDAQIQAQTRKWVDGILANQKADGYFGPDKLRTAENGQPDLWPHMLMLDFLHSYYDYAGDARVLPFMTRYFAWQRTLPDSTYKNGWGALRWADHMAVMYWLYNHTGEAALLTGAKRIHDNSVNYVDNLPTRHNVNLAQGIREPGEYWMQIGDPKYLQAVEDDYQNIMGEYGQVPGGGFAGDENVRAGKADPRQGFETCGFVEYLHTHEMMTRISGDPQWADRAEEIAFNSLPAALSPDHKGVHYITSPNLIELNAGGTQGQYDNHFAMLPFKPGVYDYRCCPHNYGMGWPYYAEESWLATADKGVAASLYTASDVTAKVGDGTIVKWSESTDYPFADTISLQLSTPKSVQFPLYLRIPEWCQNAQVEVNGQAQKVAAKPLSYVVLDRKWKDGDTVSLHLPMQIEVKRWEKNEDSRSVRYGPLWFALDIGEKWQRVGGTEEWPEFHVAPEKAWNYGLPDDVKASDFQISRPIAPSSQPFTPNSAPIRLETKARRVPGWEADAQGIVRPLQASPALSNQPLETVSLLPMGAARLRIASFPTVSTSAKALDWQPLSQGTLEIPNASHIHDSLEAINDGVVPANSGDQNVPRFTWWDHVGGKEWASLSFKTPKTVSSVSLYWFHDSAGCYVPASWTLEYQDGEMWKTVVAADAFGTARDAFNTVHFQPITTTALRVNVQLQPEKSSGIMEWKTDAK